MTLTQFKPLETHFTPYIKAELVVRILSVHYLKKKNLQWS